MRPAERGTSDVESTNREGKEIRESYLCREIVKAQHTVINAVNADPNALVRIHTEETLRLAEKFHLDIGAAWIVWETLRPENEGKAPRILAQTIFGSLARPSIFLWKGPDGQFNLKIDPDAKIPRDLIKEIERYRKTYGDSSDAWPWVDDDRSPQEVVHSLWLRYGPSRECVAWKACKAVSTVNTTDLPGYRRTWEKRHGGAGVPQLREAINQFHFRDRLDM